MAYELVFSPEAKADLIELFDYIADQSGASIAIGYIDRIELYCSGFVTIPERGTKRDDLRPGLRVVGFERRIAIAFHIDRQTVTIDRILYGGRDIVRALGDEWGAYFAGTEVRATLAMRAVSASAASFFC